MYIFLLFIIRPTCIFVSISFFLTRRFRSKLLWMHLLNRYHCIDKWLGAKCKMSCVATPKPEYVVIYLTHSFLYFYWAVNYLIVLLLFTMFTVARDVRPCDLHSAFRFRRKRFTWHAQRKPMNQYRWLSVYAKWVCGFA